MRLNAYVLAGDPAWIPEASARTTGSSIGSSCRTTVTAARGRERRSRPSSPSPDPRRRPGRQGRHASRRPRRPVAIRDASRDRAATGRTRRRLRGGGLGDPARHRRDRSDTPAFSHASSLARGITRPRRSSSPHGSLYARGPSGVFLEQCGRFWGWQAAYPGRSRCAREPPVVRAPVGDRAPVSRRHGAVEHRPGPPALAPVHAVVPPRDAVLHMSWVRTEAQMAEKSIVSGHASHRDWARELRTLALAGAASVSHCAAAPFMRDPVQRFRMTRCPSTRTSSRERRRMSRMTPTRRSRWAAGDPGSRAPRAAAGHST